jgi:lysozyme
MKNIITENQLKRLIIESDNRSDGTKLIDSQYLWDWLRWHEGSPIEKGEPLLEAYKDTVGVWTIGYGHTGKKEAFAGNVISKSKANILFIKDVNEAADCVKRFLNSWKEKNHEGYKLKLNEYESLISLVFNSGCEGLRTSDFIQKLKIGNYDDAAELIKTYKSKGLKNRRNVEYDLFKNGKYIKD